MIVKSCWAAALVFCAINVAHAGNGNELLSHCQSAERFLDEKGNFDEKAAYCVGLMDGVKSSLILLKASTGSDQMGCLPRNLSNAQGIRVLLKYLREKPENLHQEGSVLTMIALINAFPCK